MREHRGARWVVVIVIVVCREGRGEGTLRHYVTVAWLVVA